MTHELKRLIAQLVLGSLTDFLLGIIHNISKGDRNMTLRKK